MNATKKLTGTVLAITAATAFSLAPTIASAKQCCNHKHIPVVKCLGVNGCKGNSSCKTAKNACKGLNACRGQGYVTLNQRECAQVLGVKVINN